MTKREILKLTRGMDIQTAGMSKADLICAFQRAEGNIDCFGTEKVRVCQEKACLWKRDCITLTNTRNPFHIDEFFVGSDKRSDLNLSIISHIFLSGEKKVM